MSNFHPLLFGLLGFQCGLISKGQLLSALDASVKDKEKSLEKIFADQKVVTPHQFKLLKELGLEVLAQNGQNAEQYHATLPSIVTVRHDLEALAEAQIGDSTGQVLDVSRYFRAISDESISTESRQKSMNRYHAIRPYAKGGLGEVFVARDQELNREVALKEIQERFADQFESRARFRLEAEITGNLEHPGIVPVYGLGQYENGRPFYAMRLIRGSSFKEIIEDFHVNFKDRLFDGEAGLELRKLLRRFVDVCNAMAYAHSRGVLHRDLKPDNIIIGNFGETLIVDWGLAKAQGQGDLARAMTDHVEPSLDSGATPTMEGSIIGTPAYMSPEQAAGMVTELGPSTDVYGLGATLFHLLTGQPPIVGNSTSEVLGCARVGSVRLPSVVRSDVAKPLEAICRKAMAKLPDHRYSSPTALAEDIEKWLADESVSAYPDSLFVRARRWIKRHPAIAASLAAGAVLGLCSASLFAVIQHAHARQLEVKNFELTLAKNRAEQREDDAIAAVNRFGKAVAGSKELRDDPRMQSLRNDLLKEPIDFFKSLRKRLQDDDNSSQESLNRLAKAAFALGDLNDVIGNKQDAIVVYREALAIQERLARENPTVKELQSDLATTYVRLGIVLSYTSQFDEAIFAVQQSKLIRERLALDNPSDAEAQSDLANSITSMGILLYENGRFDEAIVAYKQATSINELLFQKDPSSIRLQKGLALSHLNLGNVLNDSGNPTDALFTYEQATELLERLAQQDPSNTQFQMYLAGCYGNLGNVLRDSGNPADSLVAFQKAIAIQEQLAQEYPSETHFKSDLAQSHTNYGSLLLEFGKPAEAMGSFELAKKTLEQLVQDNPSFAIFQSELGGALNNFAMIHLKSSRFAEARDLLFEAIEHQKLAIATNPDSFQYRQFLRNHYTNLLEAAYGLEDQDLADEARHSMVELLSSDPQFKELDARIARVLGGEDVNVTSELLEMGQRCYELQRFSHASILFAHALDRQPSLAEDRNMQVAYNAACAATLAACDKGLNEPKPNEAEQKKLREQAISWLLGELGQWEKFLDSASQEKRALVIQTLKHWQVDLDLASIREEPALAKLSEGERTQWQRLWQQIDELLARVDSAMDTKIEPTE